MGNACLSGAVNAPKRGESRDIEQPSGVEFWWYYPRKRGPKPLPPIKGNCLQCGADFEVSRRANWGKKFCNNRCATLYNMELRLASFRKRCAAIEPCLRCHDLIDLKSRESGRLVGLPRSFATRRRRRIGYDPARVIRATAKRAAKAKEKERDQRRIERHWQYRIKQEQKMAWAQEWRGVIHCWQAWQIERRAKNRAKGYAWQTLKRATDWEWRERTRIRMKCNGIKKAKPHSSKYIAELGCSYWQAKKHIERLWLPGMSWENHGTAWEIDHIVAVTRFDVNDPMQRLQMSHFTNLQPLWTRDNRRKFNRVEPRSSLQLVML
jgi:hypothetical protein